VAHRYVLSLSKWSGMMPVLNNRRSWIPQIDNNQKFFYFERGSHYSSENSFRVKMPFIRWLFGQVKLQMLQTPSGERQLPPFLRNSLRTSPLFPTVEPVSLAWVSSTLLSRFRRVCSDRTILL